MVLIGLGPGAIGVLIIARGVWVVARLAASEKLKIETITANSQYII